jgi:hypothetical protein
MLCGFHDRLASHVKAAFGVTLAPREFTLEVEEPLAPPIDVGFGFDVVLDLVGHLVPMTVFRRAIERSLLRKACWELEKNISRLAAAWRDRVAVAIRSLVKQSEQAALEELSALEQMLSQTASKAPVLQETIKELESAIEQVRGKHGKP